MAEDLRVWLIAEGSAAGGTSRALLERRIREISRQERITTSSTLATADVLLADHATQADARRLAAQQALPLVWWIATESEQVPEGEPFVGATASGAELAARLRAAVAEFRLLSIRIGEVAIDLSKRLVTRPEGEEALTATEAGLLRELIHAEGRVVPRDQLLRRVWGYRPTVQTRALDIALVRLRAKVEPDPAHPRWILTLRGQGYRAALEGVERTYRGQATLDATSVEAPFPDPGSPFFGRAEELRVLATWLAPPGAVIHVVALPGMGRARLAAQALLASGLGVWRLTTGSERPPLQHQLIRAAQLGPKATTEEALAAANARGELALWISAEGEDASLAPFVAAVRAAAPAARVLVTSDAPAALPGVRRLALHGLDEDAAIALLSAGWLAVDPLAIPTDTERQSIRSLARLADGMPLALEILSAQFMTRTPTELAQELSSGLGAPVGDRLGPLLARTLGTLSDEQRLALKVLARFDAPISAATAEAALSTAFTGPVAVSPSFIDALLHSLIGRALVQRRTGPGGTRLNVPRPVGRTERTAHPLADQAFLAGSAHFGMPENLQRLYGPRGPALRAELIELEPDLRRAAQLARAQGGAALSLGLACVRALAHLAKRVGPIGSYPEFVQSWADEPALSALDRAELCWIHTDLALEAGRSPPQGALDSALVVVEAAAAGAPHAIDLATNLRLTEGYLAMAHRDSPRASTAGAAAQRWCEAGARPETTAWVYGFLATGYANLSDTEFAVRLRRFWAERQSAGDAVTLGRISLSLALPLWRQGRVQEALEVLRGGVDAARINLDRGQEALDLGNVAMLELLVDEVDLALEHQERALTLMREMGIRQGLVVDLANYAEILHVRGDDEGAKRALAQAFGELPTEIAPRYHMIVYRTAVRLALAEGKWTLALEQVEKGRTLVDVSSTALEWELRAQGALAKAALGQPDPEPLTQLLGAVDQIEDANASLRVAGMAAILAVWCDDRSKEARSSFERRAAASEPSTRRDVRAIRRALAGPPPHAVRPAVTVREQPPLAAGRG